ncbi:recombinase family protein [Paenibacillus monticola]|nr:recombinase family protein [Paenibacillus monticola]
MLNRDGHTTKTNGPFSTCAIRDLLDNPMFIGKIRYNQYENWSEKRRIKKKIQTPFLWMGSIRQSLTTIYEKRYNFFDRGKVPCQKNASRESIC